MIDRVSVVVPARDEQDAVGACLRSLVAARRHLRRTRGITARLVVVLDDCRDGTAAVAARFPGVELRPARARAVGAARLIGTLGLPVDERSWLASTDADCRVPDEWLTAMVAHADAGADLVLGTVRPSGGPSGGPSERVRRAWADAHRHLGDGHRHVHGANLGVRGDAYAAAGGWAPLRSHEDVELVDRVGRLPGVRVRRVARPVVETSARTRGRAPHGFAGYLAGLAAGLPESATG